VTTPSASIWPLLATALPWWEWVALLWFFVCWVGYARFATRRSKVQPSLLGEGNRERRLWMLQSSRRDVRVIDAIVVQSLSSSPSFFASTTLLIVGGLLALLGSGEQARAVFSEIPFAVRTSNLVLEMKLLLLTGIFVYAFFRFTWSLRQYSLGALMVAAAPDHEAFDTLGDAERERFAARAGGVMGMAAESHNDGLRAYYFAFAAAAWLISPLAFAVGSAGVVWVLYQREFHSEALRLMRG
jgi:uncharacterized membrane protein